MVENKKLIINSWHVIKKTQTGKEHHIDRNVPDETLSGRLHLVLISICPNFTVTRTHNKFIIKEVKNAGEKQKDSNSSSDMRRQKL